MRKEDAELAIIQEMRRRLPSEPYDGQDAGLTQFLVLQQERPDLFTFRHTGDPWQLVHAWMRRRKMVTR